MKINKNNKTILKDLEIELGNITIFAGENNSGKTQIIESLKDSIGEDNVVFVPANKVLFEEEIATNTESKPFLKTLEKLITLGFEKKDLKISSKIEDIAEELPKIFKENNVNNIELDVKDGDEKKENYEKALRKLYFKKVIDSITIRDTLSEKDGIALTNAGQGTERLAIVSLLRYLAERQFVEDDNEKFLIIEEPEIFLHPKLKRSFNDSLLKLSEKMKIILTTHDPYFITLNENEKIYKISRSQENTTEYEKGETIIELSEKNKKITYNSHAEINYNIFGLATVEYALQLYEKYIKGDKNKEDEKFNLNGKEKTLVDYRNEIAHVDYSSVEKDLNTFIEFLFKFEKGE